MKVIYSVDSKHCVADAKVPSWIGEIIRNKPEEIYVSTITQFHAVRGAHKMKYLTISAIVFSGRLLRIDCNGVLEDWPDGLFYEAEEYLTLLAFDVENPSLFEGV